MTLEDSRLVTVTHPDFCAVISDTGEGFRLAWHDYVVNDWSEVYPDMSTAVARLALLVACCETDPEAFFATQPPAFHAAWREHFASFLSEQLS